MNEKYGVQLRYIRDDDIDEASLIQSGPG